MPNNLAVRGQSRASTERGEAPGWQVAGRENHGEKSRKFNPDCTICASGR